MNTQQEETTSHQKNLILFWVMVILWLSSYCLIGGSFLFRLFSFPNFLGLSWIITSSIPLIPLGISFYVGNQLFRTRYMLGLYSLIFLFISSPILFLLYGLTSYHGGGGRGALAIIGGSLLIALTFLTTHIAFVLGYFVAKTIFRSKNIRVHLGIALTLYATLLAAGWGYAHTQNRAFHSSFCADQAHALYSQVFFLEPITKNEVMQIVRERGFTIKQMLIAEHKTTGEKFRLELEPGISATTSADLPLNTLLNKYYSHRENLKSATTLQAYDRNEPVVWFLEFAPMPMQQMVHFVYELDIKQHRLGVYEEKPNLITGYPFTGTDPAFIKPASENRPIIQSRCYR